MVLSRSGLCALRLHGANVLAAFGFLVRFPLKKRGIRLGPRFKVCRAMMRSWTTKIPNRNELLARACRTITQGYPSMVLETLKYPRNLTAYKKMARKYR